MTNRALLADFISRTFLNADGISPQALSTTAELLADFVMDGQWKEAIADDQEKAVKEVKARIASHNAVGEALASELAALEASSNELESSSKEADARS